MLSRGGARGVARSWTQRHADSENDLGGPSETMYFIGLDVHKKPATERSSDEDRRNIFLRPCLYCRERQTRPAIVSGVLKPVKKPGSECSVRVSDDVC